MYFQGDDDAKLASEAERAFAICDSDSDGKLTQQEMAFFLRALGQNPTNAEVKELPEDSDFDAAFAHYNDNKKDAAELDHIKGLFEVWDKQGTGTIDFADLSQCLKIFGSATEDNFSDEEIELLKAEAGVEGDKFEYADFMNLMVATQQPHLKASLDNEWPRGAVTKYA